MTDEGCGTCRFWMSPDQKGGICRRNPPTPILLGLAPASPIANPGKQQQGVPVTQAFFPQMSARGWCGEHQTRGGN